MERIGRVRRFLSVFGGLTVSGAALVALGYMEGRPAQAAVPGEMRVVSVAADPALHAQRTGAAHAERTTVAAGAQLGDEPTAVSADPRQGGSRATVQVPDFVGKRYAVAWRQAKALGIKVSARDEYGEHVPASIGHLYRISTQNVAAGTAVEPGTKLAFEVRQPPGSYAMGY